MRFLPPSTNDRYSGSILAVWFLTVFSVLTIIPGCIHTFAPDGGAGTIAGLDLSQNGRMIVALFAWAGATQIAFGLAALIVSLRYRDLVPLMLALAIVERSLHALNAWALKGGAAGHHPPEHFAVLIGLPLLIAAFVLSLRDRVSGRRLTPSAKHPIGSRDAPPAAVAAPAHITGPAAGARESRQNVRCARVHRSAPRVPNLAQEHPWRETRQKSLPRFADG